MMFEMLWCHSLTLATFSFNRYTNMNDRSLAWSHRQGRTLTDGWGGKYRNSSFLVKPQKFCLTIKFFVVWPNNKKMYRAEGPGIYLYIHVYIYMLYIVHHIPINTPRAFRKKKLCRGHRFHGGLCQAARLGRWQHRGAWRQRALARAGGYPNSWLVYSMENANLEPIGSMYGRLMLT